MNVNLRASTPEDLKHLAECISLDEHHRGLDPEKWNEPLTETLTFYDEEGTVFHLRMSRVLRVDIQFDSRVSSKRVKETMFHAFAFIKGEARKSGFRELIYDSTFKPLIRFCKKHFAFAASENEHRAYL